MSFIPKPHEIYKHFKGNLYQITAGAEHTETGEQLVIYQALYGDFKTYARPLAMFVGRVDREKYPDAEQEFRFELQGPDGERQRTAFQSSDEERRRTAVQSPDEECQRAAVQGSDGECRRTAVHGPEEETTGAGEDQCPAWEGPGVAAGNSEMSEGELSLDPLLLEFLDADGYEERLNILAGLHHRITDEMITTMAIACDVEIGGGDTEERYEALKSCLVTLERYECNRLR